MPGLIEKVTAFTVKAGYEISNTKLNNAIICKLIESIDSKTFSIFHQNIRSLDSHFEELQAILSCINIPFHIIGLTETRENRDKGFKMNNKLDGYNFYSQPTNSLAGGTAFYIKNSLNHCEQSDLNYICDEFEAIWIEIKNVEAENIVCSCIYRHPSSDPKRLREYLDTVFSKIEHENKVGYIMGDFNINLLDYDKHYKTNEFFNTLNAIFFLPYILQPTIVTETSATLIDNISGNSIDHSSTSGNIVINLSDHFAQFMLINDLKIEYKSAKYYVNDFSKFDKNNIQDEFSSIEWDGSKRNDWDCNAKFNVFLAKVKEFTRHNVLLRKLSKRKLKLFTKPWINKEIQAKIKLRDRLLRKTHKTNNPNRKHLYKKVRNQVVQEIKNSKKQYYLNYFHVNKNIVGHSSS